MSTRKRPLLSLVGAVTIVLNLLTGATAHADWTPSTQVARVWQYTGTALSGNGYLYLADKTCTPTNSSSTYFIIRGDNNIKHETMMSMALAAYLSGRSVKISYSASTCEVTSIQMQ